MDTNTAAPLAAWALANPATATERWKSSSNGRLAAATWPAQGADRCEVDTLLGTTALPGLVLNDDVAELELARWTQIRLHAWRATDRDRSTGRQDPTERGQVEREHGS